MKNCFLLFLIFGLVACAGSQPTRYYLLKASASSDVAQLKNFGVLEVGPVRLPDYLDRNAVLHPILGENHLILGEEMADVEILGCQGFVGLLNGVPEIRVLEEGFGRPDREYGIDIETMAEFFPRVFESQRQGGAPKKIQFDAGIEAAIQLTPAG